jgi:hypothetical protein
MLLLLLAWACGGDKPCGEDTCPLGTTCEEGECVSRSCATSTQCPVGFYCEQDGTCEQGCEVDGDCLVGSKCTDGECAESRCTSSNLDCGWRESCVEGACVDQGDPYCAPCTQDPQCGAGNICWAGEWCGVDCASDGCPGGFVCQEVSHTDGVVHSVCLSACWLFR